MTESGTTKTCPRCGAEFICRKDDVENCDCRSVSISPETLARLVSEYQDCLCVACLSELSGS